jgi:hypothetical protein
MVKNQVVSIGMNVFVKNRVFHLFTYKSCPKPKKKLIVTNIRKLSIPLQGQPLKRDLIPPTPQNNLVMFFIHESVFNYVIYFCRHREMEDSPYKYPPLIYHNHRIINNTANKYI